MFKKIRLYGIRRSLGYGIFEARYLLRKKFLKSFSQDGEDLLIDKILGYKKKGFYVDVGAFDPYRFSNTKRFIFVAGGVLILNPTQGVIKSL